MNPYLSGIMALSQLSPEQFDMGMQRFELIQDMQPRSLSALQARQTGLTAGMGQAIPNYPTLIPQGPALKQFGGNTTGRVSETAITQGPATFGQAYTGEVRDSSGNVVRPALSPRDMNPISDVFPTQYSQPTMSPRDFQPISDVFPTQYSQPTMSPFSNVQGSFGTGAMPYTQPYYQRSFNPYSGGYGMGFGGGMPSYGGFGGGQPMYGGFGGGKGGGMPSYGGGKGGRR